MRSVFASSPQRRPSTGFTLIELLVVVSIIALLIGILLPALGRARETGVQAQCLSNMKQLGIVMEAYANDYKEQYVRASPTIFGIDLERWHGTRTTASEAFNPVTGPLYTYFGDTGQAKRCPALDRYVSTQAGIGAFERGCGGYGINDLFIGSRVYKLGYDAIGFQTCSRRFDVQKPGETVYFTDTAYNSGANIIEYSFAQPRWYFQAPPNIPETGWGDPVPSIHFRHGGKANVLWGDGHVKPEGITLTPAAYAYTPDKPSTWMGWFGPEDFTFFDCQ